MADDITVELSGDVAALVRSGQTAEKLLRNLRGPGVVNTGGAIRINAAPAAPQRRQSTPSTVGTTLRVNLSQTGGSNGNASTAATWTYNVTDVFGGSLGTAMSPEFPRPKGTMTAATVGLGYYNTSGDFVLYQAAEKPGTGSCA